MATCGSCSRAPCSCVPASSPAGCSRGPGVKPLPGNAPIDLASLACTPAMAMQPAIDAARRVVHTLGQRPYRVRLVWQEQDDVDGTWREAAALELMPVEVRDLDAVELVVEAAARKPDGVINLREVSPLQVDDRTLRGYRNGEPWGDDTATREFFFEIQSHRICPGDGESRTYRFALAGAPVLRLDRNEWQVRLTTQFGYRTPERVDQTVPDDGFEDAILLA